MPPSDRDPVGESGLAVPISYGKVSLVDDIHADENVCAKKISLGNPQVRK